MEEFEWHYDGWTILVNLTLRNTDEMTHAPPHRMAMEMRQQRMIDPENSAAAGGQAQFGTHPAGWETQIDNRMVLFGSYGNGTQQDFITPAARWHLYENFSRDDWYTWYGEVGPGETITVPLIFNRLEDHNTTRHWNSLEVSIHDQDADGEASMTHWRGPCFGDHHDGFYGRLNETIVCRYADSHGRYTRATATEGHIYDPSRDR